MKTITAYQTSDGFIFEDKRKAAIHQQDIIGELVDGLLPHDDRGNITRSDRFNILVKIMEDKELTSKINALHHALTFNDE